MIQVLRCAGKPMPWTWASARGRAEPPEVVLPAADPAAFLDRHGASHGPHLANVAAIAREVRNSVPPRPHLFQLILRA